MLARRPVNFTLAGRPAAVYLCLCNRAARHFWEDPMARRSAPARSTPRELAAPAPNRTAGLGVPPPLPGSNGVTEDQIRLLAFQKWEAAGCPAGDELRFWLAAEEELRAKA
jgi:hypothetical protein